MPQRVVVNRILITKRDAENALSDQGANLVFNQFGRT